MLTGVSHMGFTVADVGAAAGFYQRLFDAPPEVRRIYDAPYTADQVGYPGARLDIAIFRIPGSDVRLELIQYLEPAGTPVDVETKNPGTAHLCLTADDLDAEFARLSSLGARPRSAAPVPITSGPNLGRRVAYFRDPQGLTIEIVESPREERSCASRT
ncbi:VOC family protein [Actinomadura sp. WMMA1423]|uniref:VOC family protein n=1 Tax=Actinomadura sp. WMMA1423 TaxID=2591108 RepID=UPI001147A1A0|nr:VOC family protein [Actinomadura sp. WMMA1423]